MEKEELKKIINESISSRSKLTELSPGVFWIDEINDYGLLLAEDDNVYVFYEKGIPNRYIARLENVRADLPNLWGYMSTVKDIYFNLIKVGRRYFKNFSLEQFPIVNIGAGHCYTPMNGEASTSILEHLEIFAPLSTTKTEGYDLGLQVSRIFRKDIRNLDEAYKVISFAESEGFKYDFNAKDMRLNIVRESYHKYNKLSDIDWDDIMDYDGDLELISEF